MKLAFRPLALAALMTLAAPAAIAHDHDGKAVTMDSVLADARRDADKPRDQYRHPKETLAFFKVEPGMTVVEYAPGGGWYSRVLAPFAAGTHGQYIGLNPAPGPLPSSEEQKEKARGWPAAFPAQVAGWTGEPADKFVAYTSDIIPDTAKGTVDRVLVIRMMHNLYRWNVADNELKAMRALLKPDGMLGIVQHRAKADAPYGYADGNHGYLRQADLIKYVEAHGFVLVDQSEINANPKDTADYPGGVWTLPPAERGEDKSAYAAIGESDRMTLLFKKAE